MLEQAIKLLEEALAEHETTWGDEAFCEPNDWSVSAKVLIATAKQGASW